MQSLTYLRVHPIDLFNPDTEILSIIQDSARIGRKPLPTPIFAPTKTTFGFSSSYGSDDDKYFQLLLFIFLTLYPHNKIGMILLLLVLSADDFNENPNVPTNLIVPTPFPNFLIMIFDSGRFLLLNTMD